MKNIYLSMIVNLMFTTFNFAQEAAPGNKSEQDIYALIETYVQAREKKDSVLLENILTTDIDQLVSSGEWRSGKQEAMDGMMRSSKSNPGSRTITIEKIRFFSSESGIADARYVIQNEDGTERKMWSTFIVVYQAGSWKITAIRNMLPTRYR